MVEMWKSHSLSKSRSMFELMTLVMTSLVPVVNHKIDFFGEESPASQDTNYDPPN